MNDSMKRITGEITAVIERSLRQELLREREVMLESELAAVRAELSGLGEKPPIRQPAKKPIFATRKAPKPASGARRIQSNSARAMIIETLRRAKCPMTIKELTKTILRKGWQTTRRDPIRSVDAALRSNPQDFRRTAPSTFELIP